MWKKKAKENPAIKVHKLEIEKLKLEADLKNQRASGLACCVVLLVVLMFSMIFISA